MTAIRGLLHRSRATILIFILAAVGAAAAAAGPAYYQAAKVSILRDEFSSSLFVDSGFEASASGSVAGLLAPTSINVHGDLVFYLGPLARQHLFAPEVDSIESSVNVGAYGGVPIVQNKPRWRPSAERPGTTRGSMRWRCAQDHRADDGPLPSGLRHLKQVRSPRLSPAGAASCASAETMSQ